MRRPLTFSLLATPLLVAGMALSTGCTPWYANHGFGNEQELRQPENAGRLVEIVRAGGHGAYEAAEVLAATADAETLAPVLPQMFSVLEKNCQYYYVDDEHEGLLSHGCPAIIGAARRVGAASVPALVQLNPFAAVVGLGELGSTGRAGIKTVIAALGSQHAVIRGEATDALRKIGYPGPEVLSALETMVASEDDAKVQSAGTRAIGTLQAIAKADPASLEPPTSPDTPADTARPFAGVSPVELRPQDIALVIGIETYRGTLPASTAARTDARHFADLAEHALGVPRRNIILLTDDGATRSSLEAYLSDWLPKNVKPDSRVYFFFAGHGAPDPETGKGYLVPWDADPRFIARQGLELDAVAEGLQNLEAAQVVMLVDSCFSGSGGRSVLAPGTRPLVPVKAPAMPVSGQGPTFAMLAAAASNEITGTTADGKHGLFSYYVFDAMRGAADANGDGIVSLAEIADHVARHVPDEARRDNRQQTPTYRFSSDAVGQLQLVKVE